MEIPERIQKAYNELIETVHRQGVEWVNPELKISDDDYKDKYFYVIMDSASEIIESMYVDLYRVLFWGGKIRASYSINKHAPF